MADVKSWDDVKLLTVAINRLKRWTRPGLLCIGDAAHAMSPIGGVGVNLAVQDAVATANLLAAKLADGCPPEDELDAVRRRREFPVRMTQRMQVVVQNNIVSAALKPGNQPLKVAARRCGSSPPCPGCRASRRGLSASGCGPSMCSRGICADGRSRRVSGLCIPQDDSRLRSVAATVQTTVASRDSCEPNLARPSTSGFGARSAVRRSWMSPAQF